MSVRVARRTPNADAPWRREHGARTVSTVLEPSEANRRDPGPPLELERDTGSRLRHLALALPAIAALVLWRLSLLHVDVSSLGQYGLPPALPIAWYVALVLAILGTVAATTVRPSSGLIMIGSVVVVAIILYGTVPVLSAQPHYAWVYKHIGVVRYLEAHGKVNPNIDIYNRWPGFFALAAMFSTVGGNLNPEAYASWAELFFLLLDVLLLMAAVKSITRDLRIAVGAALFFILSNWVGQTYYSPQAFAFVLGLALITIMFRQLRVTGTSYSRRLARVLERVGRVPQLPVPADSTAKWPRWAVIAAVFGLDAVIVASHQLTPYMLLIGIALLMLCGVVRPWWVLVGMGVMTFTYLAANFHFIQHNYGVFSSFDPFNNAQDSTTPEVPLPGKVFNTDVELLLIVALWLGGVAAMVRLLRRGLLVRALPFAVLAVAPFVVIFGQNYGGEVSLRIILFSSPWCAALIAWALATVTRPRLKWVLTTFVAVLFAALFVPSFLGQEELNIISPAEVQASEWFYYHAPRGTVLVLAAPGFPYRYGGTYSEFRGPEGDANPNLLTSAIFQSRQLGAADVRRVVRKIEEYAKHGYIAFTKDETEYGEVMGLTPEGALANLQAAVARSPEFRPWYRNTDAQIYELVVPPKIGRRAGRHGQVRAKVAPRGRRGRSPRVVRRSRRAHLRQRSLKKAHRRHS
jgi:hypothetical protein